MIPVFKPYYDEQEEQAVIEVLRSGWVGLGPKVKEFEDKFAEFTGAKYCVGLNSGTAALDMALKLIGIQEGDEVLVPTLTFVSTAHAVVYHRATPIFVDCDPVNLTINLEDLKNKVTKRTKAAIVVHYGGRPVNLDAVREILGNLPIIEDCAHAAGSYFRGQHVGTRNIGCFSFHAVKNLAMGEGGAITTNNKEYAQRAKMLRWVGIDKGTWDRTANDKTYWWEYKVDEIGYKSHLNDVHASIGLVQLSKLNMSNELRRRIVNGYRKELSQYLSFPEEDNSIYRSSWHLCEVQTPYRDELSTYLKDRDINTGVHYKPIHLYKCYGNTPTLPIAEDVFKRILTLPLYPGMNTEDYKKIVRTVKEFFQQLNPPSTLIN